MPATVTQQSSARDRAIASIQEAHELIGQADLERAQGAGSNERHQTGDLAEARIPKWSKKSPFAGLMSWILLGLIVCVGVTILAWQPNHGQVAPDPVSTSSVSVKKTEELQTATAGTPATAPTQSLAQAAATQSTPMIAAPTAPELTRQIQDIAHQLANIAQGIEQLKTERSQMADENAKLVEQLKATRENARRNAELYEDLKATQARTAQQVGNVADQLKANQDTLAAMAEQLKETQEQVAHLVAAEQKQRAARKLVPKPSAPAPVGAHTQDQSRPQSKQP